MYPLRPLDDLARTVAGMLDILTRHARYLRGEPEGPTAAEEPRLPAGEREPAMHEPRR